jgi:plastocyanin
MPTWGQSQGGTLNDEQIRQLATFINEGSGWEIAKEYAIDGYPPADKHGDDVNHLTLAEALSADSDRVVLNRVPESIAEDVRLQIGEDEIVLVKEVDAANNAVVVERGVGTTTPEDQAAGTVVLEIPEPPGDAVPTVQAACGQTAGAVAPPVVEPPSATLSITAQGTAWNKTTLAALADTPLTLTMNNNDAGVAHNIHFSQGADPGGPDLDPPAMTEIENGPNVQTLNFGPLPAGDYYYVCDVHTNMEGVLTASAAGAVPAAGADAGATPAP